MPNTPFSLAQLAAAIPRGEGEEAEIVAASLMKRKMGLKTGKSATHSSS